MRKLLSGFVVLGVLFVFSFIIGWNHYSARGAPPPTDYIQGKVHVKHGSAAGVWVIAQAELGNTNYRKIVVTDDQGKFVIPDLQDATYDVWVRGYGLKDSPIVKASPSNKNIQLFAEVASTPQEAAEIYPAHYWYALLELPSEDIFPTPGNINQAQWVNRIKLSCELCHQMGNEHTRGHDRTLPQQWDSLFRLTGAMNNGANALGRDLAIEVFTDWATRISQGEVPPEPPPRPQGIERNIVITQWDWGDQLAYTHDEIATDKRNPTLYPYGKVWGADIGLERVLFVDPVTNEVGEYQVPFLPGFFEPPCDAVTPLDCFTLPAYGQISGPHNPMLDDQGRLWVTTGIKPSASAADQPDFCTDGSRGDVALPNLPGRELAYFDTATEEFVLIQVCQRTHHLQFDNDGILWLSSGGGGRAAYWFDPSKFDPNDVPGTEGPAQDWRDVQFDSDCDGVADTNIAASGARVGNGYGIIPNLVDGSIWASNAGYPGNIMRFDPATEEFEVYLPPDPGHGPRGIDADTHGNIWTCLGGSSHVAKFDRSKCAQTCGAGNQCPEGWTLYPIPGPNFKNTDIPSDFHYYNWVDQYNTLGLGENIVVCNGTGSDSLIAFNPETEEFTTIRTPFPLSMFQRGLDGRIDDPDAGWKGRGWWVNNGQDPVKHLHHEPRATDEMGWIQQVQLRPSPLAK